MHITKDAQGRITGMYRCPQIFATEEALDLPPDADCGWWKQNGTWEPSDVLLAEQADNTQRAAKLRRIAAMVATLRTYEADAAAAYAAWPGWGAAPKDTAMRTAIERLGKVLGGLADLLEGMKLDK